MRTIEFTSQFKRDYRREKKGRHGKRLDDLLAAVVDKLAVDMALEPHYRDHPLAGAWKNYLDCHVRPDFVLIYRKVGNGRLQLARLGSHSELAF
jgi:mRNA interferase YafQ